MISDWTPQRIGPFTTRSSNSSGKPQTKGRRMVPLPTEPENKRQGMQGMRGVTHVSARFALLTSMELTTNRQPHDQM